MPRNPSAKCYQENKERLQKKARERYQNLSQEEKLKKQQHGREPYKNLSENENKSLLNIEKDVIELEKTPYYNYKKLL